MLRKLIFILLSILMFTQYGFADGLVDDLADNLADTVEESGMEITDRKYTLDDLYEIALEKSEQIKISEEELFLSENMKKKAFSVLYPRLSAFGNYSKNNLIFETSPMSPDEVTVYGLRLDQGVTLNGKELYALKMAGKNIEKSEYDLFAIKEENLFLVSTTFYNLLRSVKGLEIARVNVKRLAKHEDAVSARLRLEEVAITALFRAKAELSSAVADLIGAENNVKLIRASLALMLNLPGNIKIREPNMSRDLSKYYFSNPEQIKETALNNRAEIKALEIQSRIVDDQVNFTRGDFWPRISYEVVYSHTETVPGSPTAEKDAFSVGINFTYTVFDGGLRNANVAETLARKRQAVLAKEAMEKKILIDAEQAYLEFSTQKSALQSFEDQVKFAGANYDAVTRQFNHGLANSVDVMDANTLLVTSERQLSDAHFRLKLAVLKLKRISGTFLQEIIDKV